MDVWNKCNGFGKPFMWCVSLCLNVAYSAFKGHSIKLTAPINLRLAGLLLHSDRLRLMVCLGLLLKDKVSTCEVPALMEEFKPIRYTERSCCDKSHILPHGLVLPPSHQTFFNQHTPCHSKFHYMSHVRLWCHHKHKQLHPAHPVWPDNHYFFIWWLCALGFGDRLKLKKKASKSISPQQVW